MVGYISRRRPEFSIDSGPALGEPRKKIVDLQKDGRQNAPYQDCHLQPTGRRPDGQRDHSGDSQFSQWQDSFLG
jgi:hypothetical protein